MSGMCLMILSILFQKKTFNQVSLEKTIKDYCGFSAMADYRESDP